MMLQKFSVFILFSLLLTGCVEVEITETLKKDGTSLATVLVDMSQPEKTEKARVNFGHSGMKSSYAGCNDKDLRPDIAKKALGGGSSQDYNVKLKCTKEDDQLKLEVNVTKVGAPAKGGTNWSIQVANSDAEVKKKIVKPFCENSDYDELKKSKGNYAYVSCENVPEGKGRLIFEGKNLITDSKFNQFGILENYFIKSDEFFKPGGADKFFKSIDSLSKVQPKVKYTLKSDSEIVGGNLGKLSGNKKSMRYDFEDLRNFDFDNDSKNIEIKKSFMPTFPKLVSESINAENWMLNLTFLLSIINLILVIFCLRRK